MGAERPSGRGLGVAGKASAAVLLFFLFMGLAPGVFSRLDPLSQDHAARLEPPGRAHPFGTDGFGRDVLSRVVHGARTSLAAALAGLAAAAVLGVAAGTLSAWRPRFTGALLRGTTSVLLAIPFLLLALVIVVSLRASFLSVTVAIAAGLLAPIARLAEAASRSILCEPYIDAARVGGAGPARILVRHVLPNAASPILTQVTGYVGVAVSAEATLSFLGLGIPAPYPSWGRMLQEGARQYLEAAPWVAGFPGLAVALTVVSASLLGDALRDLAARRRTPRAP